MKGHRSVEIKLNFDNKRVSTTPLTILLSHIKNLVWDRNHEGERMYKKVLFQHEPSQTKRFITRPVVI